MTALFIYLIPILVGIGIVTVTRFKDKDKIQNHSETKNNIDTQVIAIAIYFAIGALSLYAIANILHYIVHTPDTFTYIFKWVITVLTALGIAVIGVNLIKIYTKRPAKNKLATLSVIVLLVTVSIIAYAIWRVDAPTNTSLNWDIYHHQTLIHKISQGNFSYFTSAISDSFQFNGYSTIFHTTLAIPRMLIDTDTLPFWWYAEFFHLVTTVFASFLLSYVLTRNKVLATITAVFGAFFFESLGAYTSLFLIPQNLAATTSIILVSKVIKDFKDDKNILNRTTILLTIYILLTHYIIGTLGVLMAIAATILLVLYNKKPKGTLLKLFFLGIILIAIAFPIIVARVDLNSINRGEAAFFNLSYNDKYTFIKDVYGYSLFFFLPLGIIALLRKHNIEYKVFLVLLISNIALFIAPMPYTAKLYALGRYFVNTALAVGIYSLIRNTKVTTKAISTVGISIVTVIIFTTNIIKFKQVPTYKESATHVSQYELETAEYLSDTYTNENVLLVSDPATMHILEGLSDINTPGGAYTSEQTRKLLSEIYYSRDSQNMRKKILKIEDGLQLERPNKILLAIGGRFDRWQKAPNADKLGIHWNVWTPYDLQLEDFELFNFIDFAKRQSGFREVFRNKGIVILEVEQQ